jgi:hypothetical protein
VLRGIVFTAAVLAAGSASAGQSPSDVWPALRSDPVVTLLAHDKGFQCKEEPKVEWTSERINEEQHLFVGDFTATMKCARTVRGSDQRPRLAVTRVIEIKGSSIQSDGQQRQTSVYSVNVQYVDPGID